MLKADDWPPCTRRARRRQCVAVTGHVDGEAWERGDARGHGNGRASAESATTGVGPDARLTWVVLSEVSMLPLASSTATVTAGVMVVPAAVLDGPWRNANSVGVPGVILKAADVAAVYEGVLDAVSV